MKHKISKNFFIILVFFFLYLPILVLVVFSFNTSKMNIVFEGFTLKWYQTLLKNRSLLEAFGNTLIVSFVSTTVSTIIGTLSAYALRKYQFFGKKLIVKLLYIPIVIPEIVLGISLLSVYTLFQLDLGLGTLILSHIAFSIPYVIISVKSVLDQLNPQLEDSAKDLGASPFRVFWNVTLPNLIPGITSGAMLAFTLSLDDVVISYFTAGPGSNTLPLKIYSMIKTGITPDVNALSTIILIITLSILMFVTLKQVKRLRKEVKKKKR